MVNLFLDGDRRLRNGWWVLIFFAVLGVLVVPATIVASARSGTVAHGWQAVLAFLATGVCLAMRREKLSSVLGPPGSWAVGIPAGVLLGFGIWTLTAAVLWAAGDVTWRVALHPLDALVAGVAPCVAVAIVEELIFRGFVFQRLVAGVGAWIAQPVMAGYFLLTHWSSIGALDAARSVAAANIFIAGLLFGAIYLRTRSLAIPVALHFMLNFTQGPILGFGISGSNASGALIPAISDAPAWWTGAAFGLEASVPGTIVVSLALLATVSRRRLGTVAVDLVPPTIRRQRLPRT